MTSNLTEQRISEDPHQSPASSFGVEEEEDVGDDNATYEAQIGSLQNDLADKNRYIATLEKRLLQARRSSQSRASLLFSPSARSAFSPVEEQPSSQLLAEKDAEIADLRARLEDKERMVTALRSAARNRDIADPSFPSMPASPPRNEPRLAPQSPSKPKEQGNIGGTSATPPKVSHQAQDSANSFSNSSSSPTRTTQQSPTAPRNHREPPTNLTVTTASNQPPKSGPSPVQLLSPKPADLDKDSKRKSIDEMTKILDGMIQDRVQTGALVVGQNGHVRTLDSRRQESLSHVPSVGALAAQLRMED